MNDQSWFNRVALVLSVGVLLLGAALIFQPGPSAPAPTGAGSGTPTTFLNLSIGYDPATGADQFSQTNLAMPAHVRVVVTITNYDPLASPLLVPWDNRVIGTVGGNELVSIGNQSFWTGSLPLGDIGHTFTVHDALYNISVPIPPAAGLSEPAVVSFTLTLNWQETTNWGCVAECGGPSMAPDRMFGTLTVD